MRFNVRTLLTELALSGAGGGGGGGIPNPIPDGFTVQWGTGFGPNGSWEWTNTLGPAILLLDGQPFNGGGGLGVGSSRLIVQTGDTTITDAVAGGGSGDISLLTGTTDQTDPAGAGADSGGITVQTGGVTNTGGSPTPGDSGQITIRTGSANGGGDSGNVNITTGQGDDGGESGPVTVESGTTQSTGTSGDADYGSGRAFGNGDTGDVSALSGDCSGTGDSGFADFGSGTVTVGTSGDVSLTSGEATGVLGSTGNVRVSSGDALTGLSGDVDVFPGVANLGDGPRGRVNLGIDDAADNQEPGKVTYASPIPLVLDGADVFDRTMYRKQWTLTVVTTGTQAYGDDPEYIVSGVGSPATAVGSGVGAFAGGGLYIACSGGVGDNAVAEPATAIPNVYRSTEWRGDAQTKMRGALRTPDSVADLQIEWGIRGTPGAFDTGTDADKVIFRYDSATSPNWLFVVSDSAGATLVHDTGVAVVADRTYALGFDVLATTRQARPFIDGVQRTGPVQTAGAPDLGVPYAGLQSDAADARDIGVSPWAVSRNFF